MLVRYAFCTVDSSLNTVHTLQDYFAGLLVDQIKQQSPGQNFSQALQGVLANLQSLYQHNQLIFQVFCGHLALYLHPCYKLEQALAIKYGSA